MTVIEWLANSPYALWVNQSAGWPIALTIHAFGNAIVVGFMAIIALRLFGYFPGIPFSSLRSLIPYIWVSVVFQALSGFTLWLTKPAQYLTDWAFLLKFSLVIVASGVMVWFQKVLKEEAAKWDAAGVASSRGREIGALSCLLWAAVLIGGRMTAYLGSLYLQ
jgi:hypothetical protein